MRRPASAWESFRGSRSSAGSDQSWSQLRRPEDQGLPGVDEALPAEEDDPNDDIAISMNVPVGLGSACLQRDAFGSSHHHVHVRPGVTRDHNSGRKSAASSLTNPATPHRSAADHHHHHAGTGTKLPFESQIRGLRWKGEGVCCFMLVNNGSIDPHRAARALPHMLHLSALSAGHLVNIDLSGFRACVMLADLAETLESTNAVLQACKELASNGSVAAVIAIIMSCSPGGPDRDPDATQAMHRSVLSAGADAVLFSCPAHPVTNRQLQGVVQGTETWHERIAEAMESAQAKLAKAQEQRWQRHYQIALRKIVWKAPQTVFPHIPQEDFGLEERADGVGDYNFLRVIGSGAFGSVHLARHQKFGDVAVKVIKKASIKNIFDMAKVERELSILMGVLGHPNVLEILSCLHGADHFYIVMDFLGDYTLHTYLHLRQTGTARNSTMLPFQEVQSIFAHMLKAIAHCHAHHVCHRDIKFKNAMINSDGRVTMVDFGLAVHVAPGQELHDSCGTVPFAAPEVLICSPSKGYDGTAADIWSLAICLIEMLCGLGTVESIVGLTQDDVSNFEHIASQCLLLCTEYVHQLVLSYAGKDVQGVHRDSLTKVMRCVFLENSKTRMTVREIGSLEAFSAQTGPLPKPVSRRHEDSVRADEDARSHSTGHQVDGEADSLALRFEADFRRPVERPLLERIGGSMIVHRVVNKAYDWLLPRPEFGRFFLACPLKMGRMRAGISSVVLELLSNPEKCDLDMITNVHWNMNVSDLLFTDFTDCLIELFRTLTLGSRADSTMADLQKCLETLRVPITAGHRARLAAAQTDRCPQEVVWLVSSLETNTEDFARALLDLLVQDARLEGRHNGELQLADMERFANFVWQGSLDLAMEVVLSGDHPVLQQEFGCAVLFTENVRQVLCELGMEDEDSRDMQVLMEHAGELAVIKARNARTPQPPSMGQDLNWFRKTLLDLCKADSFLQYFAEMPKMGKCFESIFEIVSGGGMMGGELASVLRSAHRNLYLTDARFSAFMALIDKLLRAMFPWPAHPAAVANGCVRAFEGLRTEVLCGSTLRSSRLAAVEGLANAMGSSTTATETRHARTARVMAAMGACGVPLFEAIAQDSRISVFFKQSDVATQERKARFLGCALSGGLTSGTSSSTTTSHFPPTTEPTSTDESQGCPFGGRKLTGSDSGSAASSSLGGIWSSLRQNHQRFRISDYHFDVFLEHVRKALEEEDPESADLAPAQLESYRPHIVMSSRSLHCPVSGARGSSGKACPFQTAASSTAPELERSGGEDKIAMILKDMEREAASKTTLLPFLGKDVKLPCHSQILKQLVSAASGTPSGHDAQKLRHVHQGLGLLPEHRDQWLNCFSRSMVTHILPPELAEKMNTCFGALASDILPSASSMSRVSKDEEVADDSLRMAQGLLAELGGEPGLEKLIEAWYQNISREPSISVFFAGVRTSCLAQTRFWADFLHEGLTPGGRRQLDMVRSHRHLRINHAHFDCYVKCFLHACEEMSLSELYSNHFRAAVECFRQLIVST